MSEQAAFPWSGPLGSGPYPEREDEAESRLDRILLAASARLLTPGRAAFRRASAIADICERERARMHHLDPAGLRAAADALRPALLAHGLLPELVGRTFALVQLAAESTIGMRHFRVQLIGGAAMLEGMLAEMETGEGKTLTAPLPAAAAALAGVPVHVVTVNDYLARRDGEWMRPVFEALGLSVGIAEHGQTPEERRAAYRADVTYCTNKELAFDYLRDSLASARLSRARTLVRSVAASAPPNERLLLRGLYFAIVDEADSVLIDEARTPLIIAGSDGDGRDVQLYRTALDIAQTLEADVHYRTDAQARRVELTDEGRERLRKLCEELPGMWRLTRAREEIAQLALSALHVFDRDKHYIVAGGKVQIVDEYTGRVMADRSWQRGLQQLIEVKEGCEVREQQTTLARVTYQRLFRRYLALAGMSGTATEVAPELDAIYSLRILRVPTHRPLRRTDAGTVVYASTALKWAAVARAVERIREHGRPVLVGTRSVAASQSLSDVLRERGIDHVVLNAKHNAQEADIVAAAGGAGRVTIATNIAGRGTDIKLGPGVAERGGLHVILTEFHASRRIDRQLFGRAGRQGDPGSVEAIVSLDDELFRQHAPILTASVARRYSGRSGPLPRIVGGLLRRVAQAAAERANSRIRQATLQSDLQLQKALAFAGRE